MIIDENKIKDFFQGKCTIEETVVIARYLNKHPKVLDSLFNETEWLSDLHSGDIINNIPYNETELLERIKQNLEKETKEKNVHSIAWIKYAVAASLIGITVWSVLYYGLFDKKNERKNNVVNIEQHQNADSVVWVNNSNNTEKKILSDGSMVFLEKESVLRYVKAFENKERLLNLTGSAKFVVAKNKMRPFIVVEGNVSTTALGTIFRVQKTGNGKAVSVHLIKGKVVVKSLTDTTHQMFLLPGDICNYDGKVLSKKNHAEDTTLKTEDPHIYFDNDKLTTAFNIIEKLYNVTIAYKDVPDAILSGSLYSGSFDKKKTSAYTILRSICDVNDLEVEQTGQTSFHIHKNK